MLEGNVSFVLTKLFLQLLTKSQRIVAFYILYKVYNNENFKVTPFESIVLSSINKCMHVIQTQPDSQEATERRAEYSLLSDFVVSTPKIQNKKVSEYIKSIEQHLSEGTDGPDAEDAPQLIPFADIKEHIKTHIEAMPRVTGPKAFALSAPVVRDEPDVPDNCPFQYGQSSGQQVIFPMTQPSIFPDFEISPDDLTEDELQPHFFTPDFLRPLPQPEGEDQIDDEDFDDAYWLIPGMCPEPYWDINMGQEFNFAQLKSYLSKALKVPLQPKEVENIQKAFKND